MFYWVTNTNMTIIIRDSSSSKRMQELQMVDWVPPSNGPRQPASTLWQRPSYWLVQNRWTCRKQHAHKMRGQEPLRNPCSWLANGRSSHCQIPVGGQESMFHLGYQLLQLEANDQSAQLRWIQRVLPQQTSCMQTTILWKQWWAIISWLFLLTFSFNVFYFVWPNLWSTWLILV